ncbi:MAG: hydrogenase expression/formation protein HypE [Desulfobacterales bacterium]|nr:hydrogenase expression/formation protein HypE [Desulfobacterales bacterium]
MMQKKNDKILLDHGSGGKMSHRLTTDMLLPMFQNDVLACLDDGAVLDVQGLRLAFSTDTYTVDPIFFPGGDIGDLAVNGTVNDLAMCGANPLYLSVGLILEEGLAMEELKRVLQSMKRAAAAAGVTIVTGDTKVVPKGAADRLFINTSGIGLLHPHIRISGSRARPGDRIILSGTMADHGVTILTQREKLHFDSPVKSDSAPLNHMVKKMFMASRDIHVLRDPTRGGVGTALNEIAIQSQVGIHIEEDKIPIAKEVSGICELLGFDPLYLANEGKLLAFVKPDHADRVLAAVKRDSFGKEACIIGEVVADHPKKVVMKTRIGGSRIVDMLAGEQLPRIC